MSMSRDVRAYFGALFALFALAWLAPAVAHAATDLVWKESAGYRFATLPVPTSGHPGFTLLKPSDTGITFSNRLADATVAANYASGPDASLGGRPVLRVNRSGSTLQLSWPVDASDYHLEQSGALESGTSWSTVTNQSVIQGYQQTLTVPITNQNQFFRLRK